jgi:hypothetical protein
MRPARGDSNTHERGTPSTSATCPGVSNASLMHRMLIQGAVVFTLGRADAPATAPPERSDLDASLCAPGPPGGTRGLARPTERPGLGTELTAARRVSALTPDPVRSTRAPESAGTDGRWARSGAASAVLLEQASA